MTSKPQTYRQMASALYKSASRVDDLARTFGQRIAADLAATVETFGDDVKAAESARAEIVKRVGESLAFEWQTLASETRTAAIVALQMHSGVSMSVVAAWFGVDQSHASKVARATLAEMSDADKATLPAMVTGANGRQQAARKATSKPRSDAAHLPGQVEVTKSAKVLADVTRETLDTLANGDAVDSATLAAVVTLADLFADLDRDAIAERLAEVQAAEEAIAAETRRQQAAADAEGQVSKVEMVNEERQTSRPFPSTPKGVERATQHAEMAATLAADLAAAGVPADLVRRAESAAAVAQSIVKVVKADTTDKAAAKAARDAGAWLAGTFGDDKAAALTEGKTNGQIVALVKGLRQQAAELLAA